MDKDTFQIAQRARHALSVPADVPLPTHAIARARTDHAKAAPNRPRWQDLRCAGRLVAPLSTLLISLATAACSPPMDKQPDIKLNPHPVQRYELTATVDAPGAFDSAEGYLSYDIANVECVPKDSFEGARNVPSSSRAFELTRVDAHTWKGYFYRDLLKDEDYFGLGTCHWDATNAVPVFKVHGASFSPALVVQDVVGKVPSTSYFRKSDFYDRSMHGIGAIPHRATEEGVLKEPGAFFPITVTIKATRP